MMNLGVAMSLLSSVEQYIQNETLLIDMDGMIVFGPRMKRGTVHPIAALLLHGTDEKLIVKPGDSYATNGIDPGEYLVLTMNQEKIGVLAILGCDDALDKNASLLKICLEKSLENEYLKYGYAKTSDQYLHLLIYNANLQKEEMDFLIRIAHIRPDVLRIPVLFLIHHSNGIKADPGTVKKCIMESDSYSSTDLLGITLDNNLIWFKTISEEEGLHFFSEKKNWNREFDQLMQSLPYKDTIYSIYVGPVLDRLYHYNRGYKQCEWMRVDICTLGIYYINDYILRYLNSKASQQECNTIFSAVRHQLGDSECDGLCEIMDAVTQCNYNFTMAAEKLHIHKNTALYRFDKIRKILEINPLINSNERIYLEAFYYYLRTYRSAAQN